MIRTAWLGAAFVLVAAAAPGASAQAPLAGEWQAEVARRVENINGVERASDIALMRYTFVVRGDSVFGTSRRADAPADARPRGLKGTFRGGVLRLVAEPSEATIRTGDGEENRIEMIMEYELKLEGDVITGTQQAHSSDGAIRSEPRPFRATRMKS